MNDPPTIAEIVDLLDSDDDGDDDGLTFASPPFFHLVVPGQPRPLERSRFFNGGIGNRSRSAINQIKAMALAATSNSIMFGAGVPVCVSIDFYRARPLSDFVARRRGAGNLKPQALATNCTAGDTADIDNLAKLILDSLNQVVYQDDRQVVQLSARKLRDDEGTCNGRTVIRVFMYSNRAIP